MADKKLNIKVRADGAKRAKKELKGVGGAVSSLGKAAATAGSVFFAARGLINGLKKAIELGSKFDGVSRGFNNLSKSAGLSVNALDKLTKATDGTVNSIDLMTQANNAMLLGIVDSDEQMAKMFDTAQRLAEALGQDAAFGIESLVTGMGRQSKLMLDNLGIIVDTEKAYKTYAKELNITTAELTDNQKKTSLCQRGYAISKYFSGQIRRRNNYGSQRDAKIERHDGCSCNRTWERFRTGFDYRRKGDERIC